jgi:ABC-type cobalt transport system substrate-binding protein
MRKNVIIVLLVVLVIMLFASVRSMSERASYWMNRCDAAESVIDRVESDNHDYVIDVLCEGDEWCDWMEYNPE